MIQLCFGDSVKGTLTCAPHIGNTIGGATAVVQQRVQVPTRELK